MCQRHKHFLKRKGMVKKMINKITEILKQEGIEKYLINKTEKNTGELFFINPNPQNSNIKSIVL